MYCPIEVGVKLVMTWISLVETKTKLSNTKHNLDHCTFPDTTAATPSTQPWTRPTSCRSWEFKCNNSYCIYQWDVCDGVNDCGDNSDEWFCGMYWLCCCKSMLDLLFDAVTVSHLEVFIAQLWCEWENVFGTGVMLRSENWEGKIKCRCLGMLLLREFSTFKHVRCIFCSSESKKRIILSK